MSIGLISFAAVAQFAPAILGGMYWRGGTREGALAGLTLLAQGLDSALGDVYLINGAIGILSSIVDNVPLVAAAMGMYPMTQFPVDHLFWELLALCAGTGGSLLIIGSAAGVAAMGILHIDFIWYIKKITIPAAIGYVGGMATFWLMWH